MSINEQSTNKDKLIELAAEKWLHLVICSLTYKKEAKDKNINNHKEDQKYETSGS